MSHILLICAHILPVPPIRAIRIAISSSRAVIVVFLRLSMIVFERLLTRDNNFATSSIFGQGATLQIRRLFRACLAPSSYALYEVWPGAKSYVVESHFQTRL